MKTTTLSEQLAALVVAALLILTALGNAWVMLAVAIVGVAVGLLVFRKSVALSSALAAVIGAAVAVVIVVVLWSR